MSSLPPWLTDEELKELTGYVRPTCQARWLAGYGIRCFVNALGRVRVPREALTDVQSGKTKKRTEPDFSKVRKVS